MEKCFTRIIKKSIFWKIFRYDFIEFIEWINKVWYILYLYIPIHKRLSPVM